MSASSPIRTATWPFTRSSTPSTARSALGDIGEHFRRHRPGSGKASPASEFLTAAMAAAKAARIYELANADITLHGGDGPRSSRLRTRSASGSADLCHAPVNLKAGTMEGTGRDRPGRGDCRPRGRFARPAETLTYHAGHGPLQRPCFYERRRSIFAWPYASTTPSPVRKSLSPRSVEGQVGIYLCGPTVYKPPHLGHLVGPVIFDTIKRYLTFKGYAVNWVVNVTDVDDKIINEAEAPRHAVQSAGRGTDRPLPRRARSSSELSHNIDVLPRASEHMAEIISMIKTLIEKNHAYASDGMATSGSTPPATPTTASSATANSPTRKPAMRDLAGSGKKTRAAGLRPLESHQARRTQPGPAPGATAGPAGISNARP